ncbi:Arm DNA-binding domain-containing protein [Massilia sp. TWR1-2-2]|uniref:Arm DNA-binding domain-containing protein n=1 Tax=Massilia sp. TWR1-2-2 TaxID=2804584 RepID=UPI003CF97030
MALTDTFIRNAKTTKPAGQKHADGGGLHLLVTTAGKYWRMDYRFLGKLKTLALRRSAPPALQRYRSVAGTARGKAGPDLRGVADLRTGGAPVAAEDCRQPG